MVILTTSNFNPVLLSDLATMAAVSPVPASKIFFLSKPTFSSARCTPTSPIDLADFVIPVVSLILVAILTTCANNLFSISPEAPFSLAVMTAFLISSRISSFPTTTESKPTANLSRCS